MSKAATDPSRNNLQIRRFFLTSIPTKRLGTVLLLLAGSFSSLWAQDYSRLAPKTPVSDSSAIPVLPRKPAKPDGHDANTVVVPELKGIVFVSSPDLVRSAGIGTSGVALGGIAMLERPGFVAQIKSYLGPPLTFAQLNEITRSVVAFYRKNHRPLVDVVVPEQDVQGGTVQIVVTEFRVGEVRAQGNRWFSSRVITAPLALNHGDTIDFNQLLGLLDSANANPFRHVNLLYQPSAQPGYTDLVLQTQDRFPIRAYTGFDNSGTPVTGRGRWNLGMNWGNALWHDQQLSYQFTSSSNFWTGGRPSSEGQVSGASFIGHSLSWTMPLAARSSISVFGSYARTIPSIGQDFGLVGRSGQASARYSFTLPRTEAFTQMVQAGYDFKTTNNNLAFGGTQISRNSTEINQFPVGYSATRIDHLGVTSFTTTLVYSPGGITPDNTDAAFQPAPNQSGRMSARANYTYWRNDATRLTKLPAGNVWAFRFVGQTSNRSLLNTEQIAVGGPDLLRGYDPYSILGDTGIVLSNELRSRSFGRANSNEGKGRLLGQTQLLTFWDYSSLHNKNANESNPANLDASSIGLGLRYSLRSYASVRFDYGWQLQRLPFYNTRGQMANIAVIFGN